VVGASAGCFAAAFLVAARFVVASPSEGVDAAVVVLAAFLPAAGADRALFAGAELVNRVAAPAFFAFGEVVDRLAPVDVSFVRVDVPAAAVAFFRVSAFFAVPFDEPDCLAGWSGAEDVFAAVFWAAERAAADEGAMGAFLDQRESPMCG
jgi:hypothetical protein